jgi:hypothetical protein
MDHLLDASDPTPVDVHIIVDIILIHFVLFQLRSLLGSSCLVLSFVPLLTSRHNLPLLAELSNRQFQSYVTITTDELVKRTRSCHSCGLA